MTNNPKARPKKSKPSPSPEPQPNQGVEIPGRPERHDEDKEHKPAHGPGGAQPESGLRGTEASAEPGAINSPYPGDDMNEGPTVLP